MRSSLWAASFTATPAPAIVLAVAQDGTGHDTNVQAAIDAAPSNAVVRVGPGRFEEWVAVEKPLTLEGAGWQQTVLSPKPMPAIRSDADLERVLRPRLQAAGSDRERSEIVQNFLRDFGRPALTMRNTSGAQVRGFKI